MNYIKKLFLASKEILIVLFIQYCLLIITILLFGIDKSIIWGTAMLMLFQIIYILLKCKNLKLDFNEYLFPYILIGVSISVIYNMLVFKVRTAYNITNIPIILNIICSGIIGPIFEEVLFRYHLINKLKTFNSKNLTVLISTIIFSLCHTNIYSIIMAFIIGLINGYLYIKKNNILIPILIHTSVNITACFLFNFNYIILFLGIILFIISGLIIIKNKV